MKFVECVPNFSEGRDKDKINAIVNEVKNVSGVKILDVESDVDHNRTVLTFIAPLDTAVEAMFRATKKAVELIDLNHHKGEHPRMGAMDVCPFIPILDTTIEECIKLAEELGQRIGNELGVPVYLYDQAAKRPERKNLAKVRKGQFEGLREEIGKNPERDPDFGPNRIHPTAGAVAVGARYQIVNFNVNLSTDDMEFGKMLAKKIRTSGGGLPELRAKEIYLESKNQVQISTVITNSDVTSIKKVIDEIKKETEPKGIKITDTELIGLTAQKPLVDYTIEELNINRDLFNYENHVLENRIIKLLSSWEMGSNLLVDALSNDSPTPGGGSAGAVSGAMGAALVEMALGVSIKSKKTPEDVKRKLSEIKAKISRIKQQLQIQAVKDSESFDEVMKAYKIPKEDPNRNAEIQKATVNAANIPLTTAKLAKEAIEIARNIEGLRDTVMSDYRSGIYLLTAAIKCAAENVFINCDSIEDEKIKKELTDEINSVLEITKQETVR